MRWGEGRGDTGSRTLNFWENYPLNYEFMTVQNTIVKNDTIDKLKIYVK